MRALAPLVACVATLFVSSPECSAIQGERGTKGGDAPFASVSPYIRWMDGWQLVTWAEGCTLHSLFLVPPLSLSLVKEDVWRVGRGSFN